MKERFKIYLLIVLIILMVFTYGCSINIDIEIDIGETTPEIGFSSGNIANGGLMAGDNNWVYYRSEVDGWKLYKAKYDGSSKAKIADDIASEINILNDWLYYSNFSDGHKLYKIKTDGTHKVKLTDCAVKSINVVGDTIYFINWDNTNEENTNHPYRIKTDGSGIKKIVQMNCSSMVYSDGWLYFTSPQNGISSIFRMRSDGKDLSKLNNVYSHFLNVTHEYIIYWAVDSGKLCRMDLDGSDDTAIFDKNVDYINVFGEWIYFSNSADKYNIYKIRFDGSDLMRLTDLPDDQFDLPSFSPNSIYVINDYIFYRGFYSETAGDALFYVPSDGSGQGPWDVKLIER